MKDINFDVVKTTKRNTNKFNNVNSDDIVKRTIHETKNKQGLVIEKVVTTKTHSLKENVTADLLKELEGINSKINPVVAFLNRHSLKNAVRKNL